MPFEIKPSQEGYKVVNTSTGKKYSKKPLPKKKAEAQQRALYAVEGGYKMKNKKKGKK